MLHTSRYSLLAASLGLALFGAACGDDAKTNPGADAPTAPPDSPTADPLVVQTTAGPVKGSATATMRSWQGLPYAAPPVGPLRWAAPTAPATFTAVRDATKLAKHCAQPANTPFGVGSTDEDCLYLNVYAPADSAVHPVMFWIHGGALFLGESDEYDATPLVSQGVVVVTINYRLGMLGFLAHPALTFEQNGSSGNYGLMDQQFALHWVQDNIAKFGGDKTNVTIFGESAGGLSVHSHLASTGSAGLFAKAIVESGAYGNGNQPTLASAQSTGPTSAACTTAGGCSGVALATHAKCTDPCTVDKLRALAVTDILAAEAPISSWIPPVDGKFFTMNIATALSSGSYAKVPIIQGSNQNEYRLFVGLNELTAPALANNDETVYEAAIDGAFGAGAGQALSARNKLSDYGGNASLALAALGTDLIFSCNSRTAAQALSAHSPTFVYEFADPSAPQLYLPPSVGLGSAGYGAAHASELQYIWGLPRTPAIPIPFTIPPLSADQAALSATMVKYWTNFAKTGDPNGAGLPTWPAYATTGATADSILSLSTGANNIKPITDFAISHKCR